MDIRPDFANFEPYLIKLSAFSPEFWEIHRRVGRLSDEKSSHYLLHVAKIRQREVILDIFTEAKQFSGDMGSMISTFNDVSRFPTMTDFLKSLEDYVLSQYQEKLEKLCESVNLLSNKYYPLKKLVSYCNDMIGLSLKVKKIILLIKKCPGYDFEENLSIETSPQVFLTVNLKDKYITDGSSKRIGFKPGKVPYEVFLNCVEEKDGYSSNMVIIHKKIGCGEKDIADEMSHYRRRLRKIFGIKSKDYNDMIFKSGASICIRNIKIEK